MIYHTIKILFLGLICLFDTTMSQAEEYELHDSVAAASSHCRKAATITGIVLPSLMVTYGAASFYVDGIRQLDYDTYNELLEDSYFWHGSADNYVQFVPAAAAFVMKLTGVKSHDKMTDMLIIYALSNVLEGGIVSATKYLTKRERPDGSNNHSFPSGHTATAFVAAEFLHQEFGDRSVWISVGGYTVALMVGASRILNDKHWVSDVVAGAGIGILSTKAVYWVYPHLQGLFNKKNKNRQAYVFPSCVDGKICLGFSCRF